MRSYRSNKENNEVGFVLWRLHDLRTMDFHECWVDHEFCSFSVLTSFINSIMQGIFSCYFHCSETIWKFLWSSMRINTLYLLYPPQLFATRLYSLTSIIWWSSLEYTTQQFTYEYSWEKKLLVCNKIRNNVSVMAISVRQICEWNRH